MLTLTIRCVTVRPVHSHPTFTFQINTYVHERMVWPPILFTVYWRGSKADSDKQEKRGGTLCYSISRGIK